MYLNFIGSTEVPLDFTWVSETGHVISTEDMEHLDGSDGIFRMREEMIDCGYFVGSEEEIGDLIVFSPGRDTIVENDREEEAETLRVIKPCKLDLGKLLKK